MFVISVMKLGRVWCPGAGTKPCRKGVRHGIGHDRSDNGPEGSIYRTTFKNTRGCSLGCSRCWYCWIENAEVIYSIQSSLACCSNKSVFYFNKVLLVWGFRKHRQSYGINECRNENSHITNDKELLAQQLQSNRARWDWGQGKRKHEDILARVPWKSHFIVADSWSS